MIYDHGGQIFVLILILLAGCIEGPDTDVSPDRIYTSYFVIYDETVNTTLTSAVFTSDNENGFPQVLKGSAKVEFDGTKLIYNRGLGEYNFVFEDESILSGLFTYVDENGIAYNNDVELRLLSFPSDLDSLNSTEDYEFRWIGDPVQSGEVLRLSFENESGDPVLVLEQNSVGASSIFIPLQQLVLIGESTVYLTMNILRITPTDEDPGVGGSIQTSVWSLRLPVVIY
jgi:hypothetical protein